MEIESKELLTDSVEAGVKQGDYLSSQLLNLIMTEIIKK